MDNLRQQYLQNQWQAYPKLKESQIQALVEKKAIVGRVFPSEDGKLKIQRPNRDIESYPIPLYEYLKSGDLIYFDRESQEIQLLAPNLSLSYSPLQFSPQMAQEWTEYIQKIREFFFDHEFLEVQTPTLVDCPAMESTLNAFSTEWKMGNERKRFYLPTSPEIHLKKALIDYLLPVYEIKSVFRNDELSPIHQAEFLMLEWYRPFANLKQIQEDCLGLLKLFSREDVVVRTLSFAEIYREEFQFDLKPDSSKQDLFDLCLLLEIHALEEDSWDELFQRIWIEKIEKLLPKDELIFLIDFPPSQAALSRIAPNAWAERFEIYWQGFELANAFQELNDPVEQKKRFEIENQIREAKAQVLYPIDKDFQARTEYGMPPASGIALGLERFFLALYSYKSLDQARAFPL